MSRRSYCRCTTVRNYSYDEAAAKLGCHRSWLENNISSLPHQKFGHASAVFCDCELALIQAMNTVMPHGVLTLVNQEIPQAQAQPEQQPDPVRALAQIRPAGAPRRNRIS